MGWIADIGGKVIDTVAGFAQQQQNVAYQKEFAQHGLQWKMEDAKRAGLNPLAAIGAPTAGFTPTTVQTDFAGMGQDISRAIDSTRTVEDKAEAYNKALQGLTLDHASLENEMLRSQIAQMRTQGPPMPTPAAGPIIPSVPPTGSEPLRFGNLTLWPSSRYSVGQSAENEGGDLFGNAGIANIGHRIGDQWLNNQLFALPDIAQYIAKLGPLGWSTAAAYDFLRRYDTQKYHRGD